MAQSWMRRLFGSRQAEEAPPTHFGTASIYCYRQFAARRASDEWPELGGAVATPQSVPLPAARTGGDRHPPRRSSYA